jgi:hypothetical protein
VREGAAATVTSWGGPRSLAARVRRIEPGAFTKISALGLEEQRVHVVLDFVNPPPPGLGHDYRVDLAIFKGADHAFMWKPKLRIPDIYESPDNQRAFGRSSTPVCAARAARPSSTRSTPWIARRSRASARPPCRSVQLATTGIRERGDEPSSRSPGLNSM